MKFTFKTSIIGATLAMATLMPAHSASPEFKVYENLAYVGQRIEMTGFGLRNDIESAAAYALASAGSTVAGGGAVFNRQAVYRDIYSRISPWTLAASLAIAVKNDVTTVAPLAVSAVASGANVILITATQEYCQLLLRNRYGLSEDTAKWAAIITANFQLSAWTLWMAPYMQRELAERFAKGEGGERRRNLLTISPDESFAAKILAEPLISNVRWDRGLRGPQLLIRGSSRTKHGSKFYYGIVMEDIDPPGPRQSLKKVNSCKIFGNLPPICSSQILGV